MVFLGEYYSYTAEDREVVIEPAVERRMKELVEIAVKRIRELPGAGGLEGDDSDLNDVFEEWADQLAYEHSVFFRVYDDLAEAVCNDIVKELDRFEREVLSVFSIEFGEHTDSDDFKENSSLDEFNPQSALSFELYRNVCGYAIEWAGEYRANRGY